MSDNPIKEPKDAVKLLGEYLCELDREVVCVINLRSDGRPVNCNFVSIGAVNECIAHPREIFKSAILSNASSMIMLHLHPSGNLLPSKEDTAITDRMLKLSEILGVSLLDHIIVGGDNVSYFSFREKDMMDFDLVRYERDYKNLEFPDMYVAEDKQEQTTVRRRKSR